MMCPHNNIETYCPRCIHGKEQNMMSGFGKYELIPGSGIWVPDAGELAAGAASGAIATTAKDLSQSEGVKQAGLSVAGEALGTKILKAWPIFVGVAAVLGVYFVMTRKKSA